MRKTQELPGLLSPQEKEALAGRVRAARSEATWKAYATDWADFDLFCQGANRQSLPAQPETVALYLENQAQLGKKAATLQRRLASISIRHQGENYDPPTKSQLVRSVMAGIKREIGAAQRKVRPLRLRDIRQAESGDRRKDLRDRALILLGYAGGFRRSELSALLVSDIEQRPEGLKITVRRSKTDQEGAGMVKGIPYGSNPATCPVRRLNEYLGEAGIAEGFVFRRLSKTGRVLEGGLSGTSIAAIVKSFSLRCGLNPEDISGHSLRAGFVTDGYAAGAAETSIMAQTGHRSREVLSGYRREADLFQNAAVLLGL